MLQQKYVLKLLLNASLLFSSIFLFLNLRFVFYLIYVFQVFVIYYNYVDCRKTNNIKVLTIFNTILILSSVFSVVIYKIWFDNMFSELDGDSLIFEILIINKPDVTVLFGIVMEIAAIIYCQCFALYSLKEEQRLSISIIIMSMLFGVSVFAFYLPSEISLCLKAILLILQSMIAILYYFTVKNFKCYITFTITLLISNIINWVLTIWVWVPNRITNTISDNANNPGGWAILIGDYFLCSCVIIFVTCITVAVLIVCITLIIYKIRCLSEKKKISENTTRCC